MVRMFLLILVGLFSVVCATQTASQIEITTKSLPEAIIERSYSATLMTSGGMAPLSWKIASGKLPPGMELRETAGTISGTPTEPGVFTYSLVVTDSAGAAATAEFTIRVQGYLVVEWQSSPTLSGNNVSGSLKVANYSRDTFELTVIVVAVNETGKAFALGYQRMDLAATAQQVIPFSSSLPNGQYTVHADAIAEVPARKQIYRRHMQTGQPITVNVNR
jgi:hypothetical protein